MKKSNGKIEHIDYAIVAKPHPPRYLMHRYWARKPHNVVSEYIQHYSKEGDIVLDPFAGSGVTAIESLILKRKAIAVDLDSVSTFITRCTALPANLEVLDDIFSTIKKTVKPEIDELYQIRCSRCGQNTIADAVIWNGNKPIEIRYRCQCKKQRKETLWKEAEQDDLDRLSQINATTIPYWHPTTRLVWNSRINVYKDMTVVDLFTHRNLFALSAIFNAIEKITNPIQKQLMKFCFTSSLGQASKMVFVIRHRGRESGESKETKEVGSWATRGYWIPPEYFEINAWNGFEERFQKLKRGKIETNQLIGTELQEATNFKELSNKKPFLVLNQSTTALSSIPDDSVDYIFTDPPYGDSVPYLELDLLWASWLREQQNFDDEIVISDSPERKKDFDEYYRMLMQAFREINRVLRPSGWLTVTFHSTDIKIYNSIIRAVVYSGFKLDKILYQQPARASAKALLAPYGSAIGDYYLRFLKPESPRQFALDEALIDLSAFENIVVDAVRSIIAKRGQPVSYNDVLQGIYIMLDQYGYLLAAKPDRIENVLENHKNTDFEFIEGKGWWLKNPQEYLLHVIPLNERVETTVVQTLRRVAKASFDNILQDLFLTFRNALTPNPPVVTSILNEYALKTKDGKWKLKPSVEIRENEHSMMIHFLSRLGIKLGFSIFSGHPGAVYEESRVLDLKGYKDLERIESIDSDSLNKVKEIDVVWHTEGKITHVFEVENTTGITEALVRGANIPYDVKRYIVLPEERDNLLQSRMKEPLLSNQFSEGGWQVIYYGRLREFFEEHKRKKYTLRDFESIVGAKSAQKTIVDHGQLQLM